MAVYTDVADDELRAFIALYDIGEVLSCKGIAEGVENSNFLVTTERGNFILTLYEKRVAPEDLPFFIALMEHLAAQGVACPTPVKGAGRRRLARAVRPPGGIGDLPRRNVAAPYPALPLRGGRRRARRAASRRRLVRDDAGRTISRSPAGGAYTKLAAPVRPKCSPSSPASWRPSLRWSRRNGRTTCRPE